MASLPQSSLRRPSATPLPPMAARTGLPARPGLETSNTSADRSMRVLELVMAGATFAAAAILGLAR
jgi:hypothetical protein